MPGRLLMSYLEQIANWADDIIAQSGLQFSQNAAEMINTLAQKIGEHLSSHAEEYAQMASRTIFGFIGTLVDCFLGILVAFYLLLRSLDNQKEKINFCL